MLPEPAQYIMLVPPQSFIKWIGIGWSYHVIHTLTSETSHQTLLPMPIWLRKRLYVN